MVALDGKLPGDFADLAQPSGGRGRRRRPVGQRGEPHAGALRMPEFPVVAPAGDSAARERVHLTVELVLTAKIEDCPDHFRPAVVRPDKDVAVNLAANRIDV